MFFLSVIITRDYLTHATEVGIRKPPDAPMTIFTSPSVPMIMVGPMVDRGRLPGDNWLAGRVQV